MFTIGLNRAVTLIAEKKAGAAGRFGKRAPRRAEGARRASRGGKIAVRDGHYGPYVNHGKVNANVPKGKEPDDGDASTRRSR